MIQQMLREMLEISKGPEHGLNVQAKVSRKLALCQRLLTFFEENKSLSNLQSLEYLSTALMISAKLFENEEDVKSFKKHAKCCNQPTSLLKSIELEILNKFSWNIEHFCMVDYGLNFMSNYFFRFSDFIVLNNPNTEVNFFTVFVKKFDTNLRSVLSILQLPLEELNVNLPIALMGSLESQDYLKVLTPLLNSFKNTLVRVIKEHCFKSKLNGIFVLLLIIQLKEYLFGVEYLLFHKIKMWISEAISR